MFFLRKVVYIAIILLLGFFIYSHSADILGVDDSYSYVNEGEEYDNISDYYPNETSSKSMENIRVENESSEESSGDNLEGNYSHSGSNTYESEPVTRGTYVASANSDKFHTPYCGSAERIKDANRIYFSSREQALASGYSPCKKCNP